MMVLKRFLSPLFLLAGFMAHGVNADELQMRSVANAPSGVSSPSSGISMDSVLQRYGEPQNRMSAVGQPPITRWIYPNFTVYFEYRNVIHTVMHR